MSKFLYGVSDSLKIECKYAMLLGDMNISRLMTHAQQVEGDKLREQAKENKKARTENYDYFSVEIGWWKSIGGSAKVFSSSLFIRMCSILKE